MSKSEGEVSGPTESEIEIRSFFLRETNTLFLTGQFSPVYLDYYLHLGRLGIQWGREVDIKLKELLAVITLHAVSRPRNETHAWTINFQQPQLNLFATANSASGTVVVRAFDENVKKNKANMFYSQVSRDGAAPMQSVVSFAGSNLLSVAEEFYQQSEQLPVRFFEHDDEWFTMFAGMPDCDEEWLKQLTIENSKDYLQRSKESLKRLERRHYRFECGCTLDRILPALASVANSDFDGLFQGDEFIRIECPRCGMKYQVTQEKMRSFLAT